MPLTKPYERDRRPSRGCLSHFRRGPFWRKRIHHPLAFLQSRVGLDVLIYTPDGYEQLRHSRVFVLQEISTKGIVIYER